MHFQLLAAYLSSSANLCFPLWIKQTRTCQGFPFPECFPCWNLFMLHCYILYQCRLQTVGERVTQVMLWLHGKTNCRKLHYDDCSCPKNHNLQQSGSPRPAEEQMQLERCYQRRPYPQAKPEYPNATLSAFPLHLSPPPSPLPLAKLPRFNPIVCAELREMIFRRQWVPCREKKEGRGD